MCFINNYIHTTKINVQNVVCTFEVYCFVETDLREISHIQLISSFIGIPTMK